jgi:hypothetical protein
MTTRNDLCPCGSGKKFKKCCLLREHVTEQPTTHSGKFSFTPGSYGGSGSFCPSIACKKQTEANIWQYHFVLVKPAEVHQDEESAHGSSEADLNKAFTAKVTSGSEFDMAYYLKRVGYLNVEDYRIVEDQEPENG